MATDTASINLISNQGHRASSITYRKVVYARIEMSAVPDLESNFDQEKKGSVKTETAVDTIRQIEVSALEEGFAGLARDLVEVCLNEVMSAQANEACEAAGTVRNGFRESRLETRVGTITLRILKLREGSYFPEGLLERWGAWAGRSYAPRPRCSPWPSRRARSGRSWRGWAQPGCRRTA